MECPYHTKCICLPPYYTKETPFDKRNYCDCKMETCICRITKVIYHNPKNKNSINRVYTNNRLHIKFSRYNTYKTNTTYYPNLS